MKNAPRLEDIVVLRTFAIIIVVFSHAFELYVFQLDTSFKACYFFSYYAILGGKMPLYVFISGYLFSYLAHQKGRYQSFPPFIKNKFHRLIIPYVIFFIFYGIIFQNFSFQKFISGNYYHLWFLLMLFYCFLVIYPLHKFKNLYVQLAILLLALIFRISPLSANDLPFGLIYLKRFFFWFYLGYFVLYNQDKLKGLYHTLSITLLFASWIVFCILTYYEYMDIRFLNISYVFFVLFFHVLIYKLFHIQKIQVPSWIKKIDQYSYGIYIFHLFFIYLIIEHRINPLYDQTMQYAAQYPVLFPLLLFGYSFLLSLCVAKLLLKTKVGKYLIG